MTDSDAINPAAAHPEGSELADCSGSNGALSTQDHGYQERLDQQGQTPEFRRLTSPSQNSVDLVTDVGFCGPGAEREPASDAGCADGYDELGGADRDPGCLDDNSTLSPDQPAGLPLSDAVDVEELAQLACLEDNKLAIEFVQALQVASLDGEYSGMDEYSLARLRNPPTSHADTSDPDFRLGLDLFLASINSSQDNYTSATPRGSNSNI